MTWNYRLVKRPVGVDGHFAYGVHEAYYNPDGEVWAITQDPVQLSADHINELKIEWLMLMEAFKAPVLDYDDVCSNAAEPPFSMELPEDDDDEDDAFDEMDANINHDDLAKEFGSFDSNAYAAEKAEQNEKEEFQHAEEYVGSPPEQIHALIIELRSQNP